MTTIDILPGNAHPGIPESHWRIEPNGDRTCSYCGSLHPADYLEIMYAYIEGQEGYDWSPGKPGKVYARRPGVSNAGEGGIKFYGNHLFGHELEDEIRGATTLAYAVYRRKWQERWPGEDPGA